MPRSRHASARNIRRSAAARASSSAAPTSEKSKPPRPPRVVSSKPHQASKVGLGGKADIDQPLLSNLDL